MVHKEYDKEKMLSEVDEQLKQHLENKNQYNDNKNTSLIKLDTQNLLMSINNIINKKDKKYDIISNEDLYSNKDEDKKLEIKVSATIDNRVNKIQRLGILKSYNLHSNSIKLKKSLFSIKDNKNSIRNSFKDIDEEEEKDIPWIREEDC